MGINVPLRSFKVRLALPDTVNVDCVWTGWKPGYVDEDKHAGRRLLNQGLTDSGAFDINDHRFCGLSGWGRERHKYQQQNSND
jgi:hypothetical protein